MLRKLLQSALCLALAPLLVAQQIGQFPEPTCGSRPAASVFAYRTSLRSDESVNRVDDSGSLYGLSVVPFELPVELTPVDAAAWANATVGSTVTFRVVRDVIQRGGVFNRKSSYADAYAGTLIEGKVIRLREGTLRLRNGKTEPRVKEILVGKRIKLELESSPRRHARIDSLPRNLVVGPVDSVIAVGEGVLFVILLLIFCHSGCDL